MIAPNAAFRPASLPDAVKWCPTHREAWLPSVKPGCPKCAAKAPEAPPPVAPSMPGRSHFNATPTTCDAGHRHASKVEARVCPVVRAEAPAGATVYRNVRLPLFALPPTDTGLALFLNVDFVVIVDRRIVRLVDAKSGRVSRDWRRGAAACEATYNVKVEELS